MTDEPIERHARAGVDPPAGTNSLLRGSPLSAAKFAEHAARTARAYTYRGQPCRGISVELSGSAEDTERLLQGRRLSTRRLVARIQVQDALSLGFVLLPTFTAPHCTVVIELAATATVDALVALATADVIENPYYQARKEV